MKVSVVECPCGLPPRHFISEAHTEMGILQSPGFFSVEEGRTTIDETLAFYGITQTVEEAAATLQELESCGLPATDIESLVYILRTTTAPENYRREIHGAVKDGEITAEEGEKVLALAAEIK